MKKRRNKKKRDQDEPTNAMRKYIRDLSLSLPLFAGKREFGPIRDTKGSFGATSAHTMRSLASMMRDRQKQEYRKKKSPSGSHRVVSFLAPRRAISS